MRTSKTVTYTTTVEEEHTHEYAETVVEATCTEDGYTMYTCSCGDSYLEDIVDALGHNYVESETETGTVFTCSRCGDSYVGHTHSYTSSVTAPTCTEAGYTTYICSCGDSYTGNNIDALGHNYVQSGDVYICSRCGDSYSGHQHTYTETVTEPDCERDGYTTYTCSCGYSYTDNIVPALGHDLVLAGQYGTTATYYCTRCGYSYTVTVPVNPNPPSTEYGLRRSTVSVVTEHHEYVYASGTLLRETITTTDAEGSVTTGTLDFVYDLNGSPYALNYTNNTAATQTFYYITNVQGDVTHLVATDGAVVAEYEYDAWGKVTAATGTMAEVNPLRYRGYYYDAESEFYYVSSRYYDSTICRFVNADEAALIGANGDFVSLNLFAYCGNNPASRADIEGFFWHIVVGAVVGGVVSAICTAVTGGSLKETATSFLNGAFEGAIGTACPLIGTVLKIGHSAEAAVECYKNGASLGASLLAGGVALWAGCSFGGAGDSLAVKTLQDLTFGLGSSLVSAATTAGVLRAAPGGKSASATSPHPASPTSKLSKINLPAKDYYSVSTSTSGGSKSFGNKVNLLN